MAMVPLGLLCLILAGNLVFQLTAASAADAPTVATATPFYYGAEIEKEVKNQAALAAAGPEIRRLGKHHFHTSVAGGGVLIGGLATAAFAVVFCYIRVTTRPNQTN